MESQTDNSEKNTISIKDDNYGEIFITYNDDEFNGFIIYENKQLPIEKKFPKNMIRFEKINIEKLRELSPLLYSIKNSNDFSNSIFIYYYLIIKLIENKLVFKADIKFIDPIESKTNLKSLFFALKFLINMENKFIKNICVMADLFINVNSKENLTNKQKLLLEILKSTAKNKDFNNLHRTIINNTKSLNDIKFKEFEEKWSEKIEFNNNKYLLSVSDKISELDKKISDLQNYLDETIKKDEIDHKKVMDEAEIFNTLSPHYNIDEQLEIKEIEENNIATASKNLEEKKIKKTHKK